MRIEITIPEEMEPFADDLQFFVTMMVKKLNVNRHKGFGEGATYPELWDCLNEEVLELNDAYRVEGQFDVVLEAADVANFAFLLANKAMAQTKEEFVVMQSNEEGA